MRYYSERFRKDNRDHGKDQRMDLQRQVLKSNQSLYLCFFSILVKIGGLVKQACVPLPLTKERTKVDNKLISWWKRKFYSFLVVLVFISMEHNFLSQYKCAKMAANELKTFNRTIWTTYIFVKWFWINLSQWANCVSYLSYKGCFWTPTLPTQ